MARVNHKKVKQLIAETRGKITDRQFFTSRILAGHFEDMAAAQSKRYHYNRRVRVSLYWSPKDSNVASTNMVREIRLHANRSISVEFLYMNEFEALIRECERLKKEVA